MQQHLFAHYVRILRPGKSNYHSPTIDETDTAMKMILEGKTLPKRIGAFLMLLRFKKTPEEISGFVKAAQTSIT